MLLGKVFSLLVADDPVRQVDLVGYEDFCDRFIGMLVDLTEPIRNVVEGLLLSAVIYEDYSHGAFVVCLSDCSEPFLPGRVPDLKLAPLPINLNGLDFEIDT